MDVSQEICLNLIDPLRIIQFSILFLDLSLFFREWQAGRPAIFWASGFYSL